MRDDRREPVWQMPVPNGRRDQIDRLFEVRAYEPRRTLVLTVRDPETGRMIRLVRPDGDTDTPDAG